MVARAAVATATPAEAQRTGVDPPTGIASDDNLSLLQRTVLLQFKLIKK
jgi:hypothetical protein